jgi:hypothetical protein
MRSSTVSIVLIAVLAGGIWGAGLAPGSRPGLGEKPAVVTLEAFAGSPERQGAGPGAEKEDLGPVYMYGELMEKPYVFTGVGGDTLYLNGLPYYPIRQPAWRPPADMSEEELQAIRDRAKMRFALVDSVSKIVHAMHDSGATYEECLDAYVELYSASPLVRSASKGGNSITITWANGIEEVGILNFEPIPPLPTKEEIHKGEMEDFWREVRAGKMIAVGYVGELSYRLTIPRSDVERVQRVIAKLAAGDTLAAEDVSGPFVNKAFRMDMTRRAAHQK